MMKKTVRATTAETQAAEWFVRLSNPAVSFADIEAFQAWCEDPRNRSAFEAVETLWAQSGVLAGDPEIQSALALIPRRKIERAKSALPWTAALGGGLLAVSAAAAWILLAPQTYSAPEFSRRTIELEDGSVVQLDAGARISARFDGRSRRLSLLRGRALFDVAKDPSRRFVVQAGGTKVLALGTRFVVNRDKDSTSVALIEGRLEVRKARRGTAAASWILGPGEGVPVSGGPVEPIDPARIEDWADGRFVFRAIPLDEAAAEMNRYARRAVRVEAGPLSRSPISGAFEAGQEEAFAYAAAEALALVVVTAPDGGLVLKAAGPPAKSE
jgi:transmembrane sensor